MPAQAADTLRTILFPTDLSEFSDRAFAHALCIAAGGRATLEVLHVTPTGDRPNWAALKTVRHLLKEWKTLPEDASVEDFHELGITVNVHSRMATSPERGVLKEIAQMDCDLVVMPTHARVGLDHLLNGSVSETIARHSGIPTLFLPHAARDLVDPGTGVSHLAHVVMAVAVGEDIAGGIAVLHKLAASLGLTRLHVELAHAGTAEGIPDIDLGAESDWSWSTSTLGGGDVAAAIAKRAMETTADLVVMVTRGHDSLGDVLLGSTTERVIRRAPCPVLAVPELI